MMAFELGALLPDTKTSISIDSLSAYIRAPEQVLTS
jgi:hypothetical protein